MDGFAFTGHAIVCLQKMLEGKKFWESGQDQLAALSALTVQGQ